MVKRFLLCLSTVLCFFLISRPCQAESIKIGLLAPITGAFASEGKDMRALVELLVDEVNKNGGINGKQIQLLLEDDGSDPRTAANAANKLVAKDVKAVIGTYGSAISEAAQDIFDEADVVQIATGSTSIRLTEKKMRHFFRTCPRDDQQGRVAVETIVRLGHAKIAVLHDNSAYAKGLAEEAKKRIALHPELALVFYDALQAGERDYTAILTKLKGVNPDIIFFTGYYPEAGMLLRQMHEMKWRIPLLGGDATNNRDLVKIAGLEAAVAYRFISPPMPGDLQSPAARHFLAAYQAKYQEAPSSIWSVVAGDAFNVLVEAIKHRGYQADAIADYLHNTLKDYEGLTGKISFNAKGDREGDLYRLYEVDKQGNFILKP